MNNTKKNFGWTNPGIKHHLRIWLDQSWSGSVTFTEFYVISGVTTHKQNILKSGPPSIEFCSVGQPGEEVGCCICSVVLVNLVKKWDAVNLLTMAYETIITSIINYIINNKLFVYV